MAYEWVRLHDDIRSATGALQGAPALAPSSSLFLPVPVPASSLPDRMRRSIRDLLGRLSAGLDQPMPRTAQGEPIIRGGRWVGDPAEPASSSSRTVSDRRP